ncbi:MAG: glycosyltransferase family 2 protein [Phycisphaerales bacterium]|nr:glycosyltransferase family 2 protein [Phycisphaerales bacterium]
MDDAVDLAVVVTTFNSIRTIDRCLQSVRGIAKDIYVVDSGSTDGTIAACEAHGAHVIHHVWEGYARQKAFALSLATTQAWVLILDSDESLEPSLQAGLREAIMSAATQTRAIAINRKMWYCGDWMNHVGFPDWVLRCGRLGALRMIDLPVHERLEADGPTVRANGVCRHDTWDGVCDGIERSARYARLSATIRSPTRFPLLYTAFSVLTILLKHGVLRLGFLDGRRGLTVLTIFAISRFATTMAAFERRR